jgi:hypothetical protein
MSEATEGDYRGYLAQQLVELRTEASKRREAVAAQLAPKGLTKSGASIKLGVAALDDVLTDYVVILADGLNQWPGVNLSDGEARRILVGHLHEVLGELIVRRYATRFFDEDQGSVGTAFDGLLGQLRAKLESRVRTIELGITAKPAVQSVTTNNVTAETILGPILQGGSHSTQSAVTTINAAAVAEALGELRGQLPQDLQQAIEHDAEAIRRQLAGAEPNRTILQEAGKSIRNIVEGAVGGALGGAIPTGLPLLLAAMGLG